MNRLPDLILYLCLGVGAALENVVPVIPADVFVALGGFLSVVGDLQARWVFLATWLFNAASALLMYRLAHTGVRSCAVRRHKCSAPRACSG